MSKEIRLNNTKNKKYVAYSIIGKLHPFFFPFFFFVKYSKLFNICSKYF